MGNNLFSVKVKDFCLWKILSPLILFTLFFFLYEQDVHVCSKFKNELRKIPASAKEQSLKFLI